MRDRRGVIIYVGKAKNLRRRVSSYFRAGAHHAPKVRSMVDTIYDFEFMTVRNEAESLLTEASLIKKYKPHFNILMRDDKRYLALRADTAAKVPRFSCVRQVKDDGARYFGPFPSSPVVRAAKDFVEKKYGIRNCRCECPDAEAHKHCSADIIRNCSAPCVGRIGSAEYRERFEEACEFLDGKRPSVIAEVGVAMKAASEKCVCEGGLAGVLGYTDEAVVSTDFRNESKTSVFDVKAGIQLDPTFVKVCAWYDNEWGYSNKVLEMARVITKKCGCCCNK